MRHVRHRLIHENEILERLSHLGLHIPRIVSYRSENFDGITPYILLDHGSSVPLSTLMPLEEGRKAVLEKNLKSWLDSVAKIKSSTSSADMQEQEAFSWRERFLAMSEKALREAESMMLNLPYDRIRTLLGRSSFALEDVDAIGLVIPKAARISNLMVDPSTMTVTGLVDYTSYLWGDPDMMGISNHEESSDIDLSVWDAPETVLARRRCSL